MGRAGAQGPEERLQRRVLGFVRQPPTKPGAISESGGSASGDSLRSAKGTVAIDPGDHPTVAPCSAADNPKTGECRRAALAVGAPRHGLQLVAAGLQFAAT